MGRLSKQLAAARTAAARPAAVQGSAAQLADNVQVDGATKPTASEMPEQSDLKPQTFRDFVRDNKGTLGNQFGYIRRRHRNPNRAPNHIVREYTAYFALFMAIILIGTFGFVMGVGLLTQVYKDFEHTLSISGNSAALCTNVTLFPDSWTYLTIECIPNVLPFFLGALMLLKLATTRELELFWS